MSRLLAALAAGLLFGVGLALAGMTDPAVVLGFLDLGGDWNPALLFVMGTGVVVAFFGYRLVLARPAPALADAFELPTRTAIDFPLVAGAALFGVGWGLAGYCPGPAVASTVAGDPAELALLGAMVIGLGLGRALRRRYS